VEVEEMQAELEPVELGRVESGSRSHSCSNGRRASRGGDDGCCLSPLFPSVAHTTSAVPPLSLDFVTHWHTVCSSLGSMGTVRHGSRVKKPTGFSKIVENQWNQTDLNLKIVKFTVYYFKISEKK
jgi:hypothetical protein